MVVRGLEAVQRFVGDRTQFTYGEAVVRADDSDSGFRGGVGELRIVH